MLPKIAGIMKKQISILHSDDALKNVFFKILLEYYLQKK